MKKSYKLAKFWAKMSAEQGFAESQYGLGQLYLRGEGVSRSYAQAKHWFEPSPEHIAPLGHFSQTTSPDVILATAK